jgi:hypothetical protein
MLQVHRSSLSQVLKMPKPPTRHLTLHMHQLVGNSLYKAAAPLSLHERTSLQYLHTVSRHPQQT